MEQYIEILQETTKRQGFYAHTPDYFRKMWTLSAAPGCCGFSMRSMKTPSWFLDYVYFQQHPVLSYGASRDLHRNVMASNLIMWEMIKLGKGKSCTSFDMWGSLGPEPKNQILGTVFISSKKDMEATW